MAGIDIIKLIEEKKALIDRCIKELLPEKLDSGSLERIFGKPRYTYSAGALTKALSEPIWDFLNRGGKRWRPFLFLLTVEALGGDMKKLQNLCALLELIHEGSIMVDDIEDLGELRRGKPCTHKIYGVDVAINAGNFMYFLPFVLLRELEGFDPAVTRAAYDVTLQELINVHAGQGMDIIWHKGAGKVDEQEYLQMCAYKTGCLSRMSTRLAAVLCGANKEQVAALGMFGEAIGVGFQIQDDILSASSSKFAKGKGYGDDITEGKRTLMVIYALKHLQNDDRNRLLEILDMHTRNRTIIAEAIALLKKCESVDYAREAAKKIVMDAWNAADMAIVQSPAKEKLKAFADYLIKREI